MSLDISLCGVPGIFLKVLCKFDGTSFSEMLGKQRGSVCVQQLWRQFYANISFSDTAMTFYFSNQTTRGMNAGMLDAHVLRGLTKDDRVQ